VKKYNFHPPKKFSIKFANFCDGNGAQNGIICRPLISSRKKKALDAISKFEIT
jgi:hypothetical protein